MERYVEKETGAVVTKRGGKVKRSEAETEIEVDNGGRKPEDEDVDSSMRDVDVSGGDEEEDPYSAVAPETIRRRMRRGSDA